VTILNGKYSPQSIQGSFDALLCRRKDENPSEDRYSSILPQNSPTNSTKFNRDIELGISKILHSWSQKKQSYHIYHNDRNSLHHQSCKNNDTLGLTGENKRRIFQKGSGRYALLAYICHIHHNETGSLIPEIPGNTTQIGENKKRNTSELMYWKQFLVSSTWENSNSELTSSSNKLHFAQKYLPRHAPQFEQSFCTCQQRKMIFMWCPANNNSTWKTVSL